jgi:acetyl-CoA C-acetyltransferase
MPHDRLARVRVTAGGPYRPLTDGMLETAGNLRPEYGMTTAPYGSCPGSNRRSAPARQPRSSH